MAISPNQEEQLANEIRRIYEDSEMQLLKSIARRLAKDGQAAEWQMLKLAEVTALLRDARREVSNLDNQIPEEIQKIINLAYIAGDQSAVSDLKAALQTIQDNGDSMDEHPEIQMALFPGESNPDIDIEEAVAAFSAVNTEAVAALAAATTETITSKHTPIVREVEDIYRAVITEVAGATLTGAETRLEIAQRALNKFADRGVKVFRDNAGRNWEIASYSEMATRTAIGQASLQGHTDKMQDMGFDLIQVSDHHEECDLCRPWEGKVLSVSGEDREHPSLAEATGAGLFHPRCGHRGNTYFEGITKPLKKTADPKGDKLRQEQRYIERNIRKWKKREAVAITDKEQKIARKKVRAWQARAREFTAENGRRRKYERESITRAR